MWTVISTKLPMSACVCEIICLSRIIRNLPSWFPVEERFYMIFTESFFAKTGFIIEENRYTFSLCFMFYNGLPSSTSHFLKLN